MNLLILNGPNLNLLGSRETAIYGRMTLEKISRELEAYAGERAALRFFQSNHEGALIDALHDARDWADGAIINPGGLMHSSLSLRDAIAALPAPTVEVHISNVYAREPFRHHSLIAGACAGQITGLGWRGYLLALEWHLRREEE